MYLSSPNIIAVLDHERKRTYVIKKEGLPDAGESPSTSTKISTVTEICDHQFLLAVSSLFLNFEWC